jgi:hypothetical protein
MASREAVVVPTKAAVRRAVPREAAGKIQQPDGGKKNSTGARVLHRGLLILYLGYFLYQLT